MSTSPYNLYEEMMNPGELFFEDEERDGFYIWTMMKRFWAAQMKVLAEIDKICKKYGLTWYADNGTLLGAVRHGGYIPWDDDMDISMLRDDYRIFMEHAADELPEGYEIKNIYTEESNDNMIGRIVNTHLIDYSDEHLATHFGCPYMVGVDIFPLDGLYNDEKKEEERVRKIVDIANVLVMIQAGKEDSYACQKGLSDLEKKHHVVFKHEGKTEYELKLLIEKLLSEYPTKNAKNVAFMPFWVKYHNHKYDKEWFKDVAYLPFEYIHVPVPARYHEVLMTEYGDYMRVIKGGGAHEYPLFKGQEDVLTDVMEGENPYRFTMPSEIPERKYNAPITDRYAEIETMLRQVHAQIGTLVETGQESVALQLLEGCRTLAGSIAGMLSDRGDIGPILDAIENYKNETGKSDITATGIALTLNSALDDITGAINGLVNNRKREVLFLPVKADWWETMEPEWRKEVADPDNDVYVMPLLYLQKDFIKEEGEEKNDGSLLPDYVNQTTIEEYDIAKRLPDRVYIQDPYDGFNTMIAVPSYFYSGNLLKFTDELIYVPCYDVDDPESDDDKIISALKILVEQPAVYYADKIVLKSEKLKDTYVDLLVELTAEDHREYWSDKIEVSGSHSKSDRMADKHAESAYGVRDAAIKRLILEGKLPEEWKNGLDSGKKLLIFQINTPFVLQYGQKAIDKVRDSIKLIRDNLDSIQCIFTPNESLDGILNIADRNLGAEYSRLIADIKNDPDIIYDEDHTANSCYLAANAYYGTPGVLAHKCRMEKIPVMLMNAEC